MLLVLCARPGEAGTCGDSLRCWAAALFTLALRTLPLGLEEIGRRERGFGTPPAAEGALMPGVRRIFAKISDYRDHGKLCAVVDAE